MDSNDKGHIKNSRRDFLKKVPMGLIGALTMVTIGGRLFRRRSRPEVAFGPDSIFRPRDGSPSEL